MGNQWVGVQTRVAKRSRKLIDYDSARHHMETLQASGMKNDRKMVKVGHHRVGHAHLFVQDASSQRDVKRPFDAREKGFI